MKQVETILNDIAQESGFDNWEQYFECFRTTEPGRRVINKGIRKAVTKALFLSDVMLSEAMRWTKLSDDTPTVENNGEKVLLCRLLNDGQSTQNPSIYPTIKIHLCNPDETWWMEIPKLPI